ncbi:hypothetical protein [Vallitalea guaymasensis]|nr:hypothetical protein [Vallitalea guaymasensis]
MKKLLSLVLVMVLIGSFMVGCSGKKTNEDTSSKKTEKSGDTAKDEKKCH